MILQYVLNLTDLVSSMAHANQYVSDSGRRMIFRPAHGQPNYRLLADNPVVPTDSYHYVMMMDAGRIPGITDAVVDGAAAPPHAIQRPAAAIIAVQRDAVRFAGLKKYAGLMLLKPLGNGKPSDEATAYLQNHAFRSDLKTLFHMSRMNVSPMARFKIRFDTELEMVPEDGNLDSLRASDFVTVGAISYHVPWIVSSRSRTSNGSDHSINGIVQRHIDDVEELVERGMNNSHLTLNLLIGSFCWATVTNASTFAGGSAKHIAGTFLTKSVPDKRCIARAIISACDSHVAPRLGASFYSLSEDALAGATADLSHALTRAAAPGPVTEAARLRRLSDVSVAKARKVACEQQLLQATAMARSQGLFIADPLKPSEVDACRAVRRHASIEAALQKALRGHDPLYRLNSAFFQTSQQIDDESVAFIRSCLPPTVKVQFWVEGMSGSAALAFPAHGATLDFLRRGGRIVNLLCSENHVSLITSVSRICSELTRKNQRVYCELCGHSVSHGTATTLHSRTALALHQERGCPVLHGAVFPSPLTTTNVKVLSTSDYVARFPLQVHATASVRDGRLAMVVSVATPWGRFNLPPSDSVAVGAWVKFFERFPSRLVCAKSTGDFHVLHELSQTLDKPGVSDAVFGSTADTDGVLGLFSAENTSLLLQSLSFCMYRNAEAVAKLQADGPHNCFFCHESCASVSVASQHARLAAALAVPAIPVQVSGDGDYDSDDEEAQLELRSDTLPGLACYVDEAVLCSDPATGDPHWCHKSCLDAAYATHWPKHELIVDVDTEETMQVLLAAVMSTRFIQSRCANKIPAVQARGRNVRTLRFVLASHDTSETTKPGSKRGRFEDDDGLSFLRVKIRGAGVPGVSCDVPTHSSALEVARSLSGALLDAERDALRSFNLSLLYFESDIAFSRAALYDSYSEAVTRPVTTLVDPDAYESYDRIAKGGRILTGCRVINPPLLMPFNRSIVRLCLDFTAKYPHVPMEWMLPHEGHADRVLGDYSEDLAAGLAYISSFSRSQPVISRVEISGAFPPDLHARLAQFPPLFSRRIVEPALLSPFQRVRLGVSLTSEPRKRSIAHLLPLEKEVVFQREAAVLLRLGFKFTRIGVVRGCPASFWARDFMERGERLRRAAVARGDNAQVANVKRLYNSVVGSTNMNVSRQSSLKSMWEHDLDVADGFSTGGGAPVEGRQRRNFVRMSDDPRFTGRVFAASDVTLIERHADKWVHKAQPEWALAVQAYARVDHLELWYGDSEGRPGILDAFPDAKVLYGNTDSIIVELRLTDSLQAAGYKDARVALVDSLPGRFDLSNVPLTSTFWSGCGGRTTLLSRADIDSNAGKWGLIKEETGMAGYETVVVNGPNRWGARVLQSDTDTLPKHRTAPDNLKMLPKAWIGEKPSLEMYAMSWAGAAAHRDAVDGSVRAALESDCATEGSAASETRELILWGNSSCVVGRDGSQYPFGAQLPEVANIMRQVDL